MKFCIRVQRRIEQHMIDVAGYLVGAELFQMFGEELGVQKSVAAVAQPSHKMHQSNL